MRADNLINGGDPNLDELLRQSFLDLDQNNPANDQLFDATSKDVFGKEWPGEINAQKEAELLNAGSKSVKWPWYLAGTITTGVIATAIVMFGNFNNSEKTNTASNETIITTEKNSPLKLNTNEKDEKQSDLNSQNEANAEKITSGNAGSASKSISNGTQLKAVPNNTTNLVIVPSGTSQLNNAGSDNATGNNSIQSEQNNTSSANISISYLETALGINAVEAEKVKEETQHEKEKLLKEATAYLLVNYVPLSGTSSADGTGQAAAAPYFMKSTEISVREYKAFLNDLLLQGKLDDYEIARPKHKEKLNLKGQEADLKFFNNYFSNPYYKNHPMVFISPEGANMYCQWLQDIIRATGNFKFQNTVVDLPRSAEWVKAAQAGNKENEYSTKNGKLKESKYGGLFSGAYEVNFKATQKASFSFMYNENPLDLSPNADSVKLSKSKANDNDLKNNFTCQVRDYAPNPLGLYNMSGNVSEMVKNHNRSYSAIGGNWNSSSEYLQITWKEPEFRGELEASPYIGFRPVIKGIRK